MKYYIIDEISASHMEKIEGYLRENAIGSEMEKIFWVELPNDILTGTQYSHKDCKPHVFAIEMSRDKIKLELFTRSLKGLSCECQSYSSQQQREFIFKYVENMIDSLSIRT
jgi:hypothetical protein